MVLVSTPSGILVIGRSHFRSPLPLEAPVGAAAAGSPYQSEGGGHRSRTESGPWASASSPRGGGQGRAMLPSEAVLLQSVL